MSDHGYETGRLNLPFVGVSTFAKRELVTDWSQINADVAVLGAPFDFGTQWRAGARFGPRGIREASTLFSFGHSGAYDHEDDITYLNENVRIVDIGDADIIHTDTKKSHKNIEDGRVAFEAFTKRCLCAIVEKMMMNAPDHLSPEKQSLRMKVLANVFKSLIKTGSLPR